MIILERQNKVPGPGVLSVSHTLLIGFVVLISYLLFLNSSASAAEAVGRFTHVEGKVDILHGGAFPAVPAKVQDQLYPKDIVRTKSSSKAEILFKDNTVLRIGQRSRIDVSEYVADGTSKGVIRLSRGQVKAIVDKNVAKRISLAPDANRFEIQTPNAVAGVRGTEFFVAYDRNITTVLLRDGNVCVFNMKEPKAAVCMPPGYIVSVTAGLVPQQPRKATETEMNIFEKETSPGASVSKTYPETATELLVGAGAAPTRTSPDVEAAETLTEAWSLTETPATINDIPISQPITEVYHDLLEPISPGPEPEKFISNFGSGIWSRYPEVSDGTLNAVMQGTSTLWTATEAAQAAARINGTYSARNSLPHIWFEDDIHSFNSANGTNTTSDGGAYRGFIGGREINSTVDTKFNGLYLDPYGNIGFLRGDFGGLVSGGNLSMNGNLHVIQMGWGAISPSDFYNSILTSSFTASGEGSAVASGTYNSMNIAGHSDWGISQMVLGGTYSDTVSNAWTFMVGGSNGEGHLFDADLTGSQWSSNRVSATAAGYWVDARTSAPTTGIYIGETFGTFNPADHTWQSLTDGTWMETNKFLQMAGTAEGRSKLRQVNIPAFEVGRTDLSGSLIAGSDSSLDYVSVIMNDVTFFAPSTGEKPGVWATNNVTGQYDFSHGFLGADSITNADNVIPVSNGDGINADFQFTRWNTSNNTWTAGIKNGSGTLSGGSYNGPVTFRGGAAGSLTGTTSGSLSGTASGIVK